MAQSADLPLNLDAIHPLVTDALGLASTEDWPRPPHRGGPMPGLRGADQLAVALFAAGWARPFVPGDYQWAFDRAVWLAGTYHQRVNQPGGLTYADLAEVEAEAAAARAGGPAASIGWMAVSAARCLARGGPAVEDASQFSRQVVRVTAGVLGATPFQSIPPIKAFLSALDNQVLVHELATQHALHGIAPGTSVTDVLLRPPGSGRGPALILARLDGDRLGLWYQVAGHWRWLEDARDEVLACVPDAHFAAAVAVAVTP